MCISRTAETMEPVIAPKGWGREVIFADNELYAGKLLEFGKGNKFSMHFHKTKDETWYVMEGEFLLSWICFDDATQHSRTLKKGEVLRLQPLYPHQLECLSEGKIIEVSTPDNPEDNYRIAPGDSQS